MLHRKERSYIWCQKWSYGKKMTQSSPDQIIDFESGGFLHLFILLAI
jgi:hypothetical protein